MSTLIEAYRLPLPGWPRAIFEGDHAYTQGRLRVDGEEILAARSREELLRGMSAGLAGGSHAIELRLEMDGDVPMLAICVDGEPAVAERDLRSPPSRSAWRHAFIALFASVAGFIASYLYLEKAWALDSAWSLKMAYHTAGWHLLLVLTLFPASVWGQRLGIRSVQATSLLFFCIHLGIAIANAVSNDPVNPGDFWIGTWNALSGAFFLAAVVYGNVAYRDMDPVAQLIGDEHPGQVPAAV